MHNNLMAEQKIDREFIKETLSVKAYLEKSKRIFDDYDKKHKDSKARESLVDRKKSEIFVKLNKHFKIIWDLIKALDLRDYKIYQDYYYNALSALLLEAEINNYIYRQPLGYPGDYVMMNYIYDYQGKYLGGSSWEKLINDYTCNIPISKANIRRKTYFKKQILSVLRNSRSRTPGVFSVACGPVKEIKELLEERSISKPVIFNCLDFEEKALKYAQNSLAGLPARLLKDVCVNFIQENIISLVRAKDISKTKLKKFVGSQNIIYCSGLYDYLNPRIAQKLTQLFFRFLRRNGILFICNASDKNKSFKAYFEFLGRWKMIYRSEEELLSLAERVKTKSISLEHDAQGLYNFLVIKKQ